MVAVARALSGDVRVLLLDEPFEGLAPAVVEQLFESFDKLRQEVAIIIVDHHLDLALALSDRTVALGARTGTVDGRIEGPARRSRTAPQGSVAIAGPTVQVVRPDSVYSGRHLDGLRGAILRLDGVQLTAGRLIATLQSCNPRTAFAAVHESGTGTSRTLRTRVQLGRFVG